MTRKNSPSGATTLGPIPLFPGLAMDVAVEASFLSPNPAFSWIDGVANARYALNHVGAPLQWGNPTGASFRPGCSRTRFSNLNASGGCGGDQIGPYVLEVDTNFQSANIFGSTNTNGPWSFVGSARLTPTDGLFAATRCPICWARLVYVLAVWASSGR